MSTEKIIEVIQEAIRSESANDPYDSDLTRMAYSVLTALQSSGYMVIEGWKPKDQAPTDGTKILAWTGLGYELTEYCPSKFTRYDHVEGDLYRKREENADFWNSNYFKLWCMLPPPPQAQGESEERNAEENAEC
jgi:hypothetical protein